MNHPIVSAEHDDIPSLRLVLPGHLGRDETLAGLAGAIGEVRTGLAIRAWLCRQLEEDCAASGDVPARALCRGQALGAEHAAAQIDEAIIAVFGLWGQYTAQAGALPERDALPAGTDPAADGETSATTRGVLPLPRAEIRLHQAELYTSIYGSEGELLVSQHAYGVAAASSPVLHLRGSATAEIIASYLTSFERVWRESVADEPSTRSHDGAV